MRQVNPVLTLEETFKRMGCTDSTVKDLSESKSPPIMAKFIQELVDKDIETQSKVKK
jgi:hypothetical protein